MNPADDEALNRHRAARRDTSRSTPSGIPVEALYADPGDIERLGLPGQHPFLRGVHAGMYRDRAWTMRQYAGFGSAAETNKRFRFLLEAGQTGLSTAFDLPTQMGYDPDHPLAAAEVGCVGVSIVTLEDALALFDGIPLNRVSTSMTINATAIVLLALYAAVGREQGVAEAELTGTIQNDILKEYAARGTWRFPPRPSLRLVTDIFAAAAERLPRFNPISVSGYHMREAGCTAAQEIGFTLANGIAYVAAARDAGLAVDSFAPRISFFFNAHNDVFEEIAKFRAARRLWATIMKERFDAKDPRSCMLRFHTQTAGSTLTARQPMVNVVRVAYQALAAVLGGTQSLHTNAFDEALSLPSEDSARLALRTQQVIECESGVTASVDPLGGAPFIEALTDALEGEARRIIGEVDQLGGGLCAIEQGFVQREIQRAAFSHQRAVEAGTVRVVGVNCHEQDGAAVVPLFCSNETLGDERREAVKAVRSRRAQGACNGALARVVAAARGKENMFAPVLAAVEARATIGEICSALETVFGKHREVPVL
ncbi:MAG: methylmalonyl-CoA mutase [Planctomycetes bacterium]|nr:methylmalonyl-CoA mutase [Planctomycetota bacterium]